MAPLGLSGGHLFAAARRQRAGGRFRSLTPAPNQHVEQTGQFVFSRIWYGGYRSTWNHDYPRADLNLPKILDDVTTIDVHVGESNVFRLDDPELFNHPIIYISEPGFWQMSEREVRGLRDYWLKGGFVIFDDFEAGQWDNFALQVRRALPNHRLIEIDVTHPIFHVFFGMQTLDFPHPLVPVEPSYWGIFEDNDPAKRMMAIVNYNNDIAEYWEWSAEGVFSVDFTERRVQARGELHRLRHDTLSRWHQPKPASPVQHVALPQASILG